MNYKRMEHLTRCVQLSNPASPEEIINEMNAVIDKAANHGWEVAAYFKADSLGNYGYLFITFSRPREEYAFEQYGN